MSPFEANNQMKWNDTTRSSETMTGWSGTTTPDQGDKWPDEVEQKHQIKRDNHTWCPTSTPQQQISPPLPHLMRHFNTASIPVAYTWQCLPWHAANEIEKAQVEITIKKNKNTGQLVTYINKYHAMLHALLPTLPAKLLPYDAASCCTFKSQRVVELTINRRYD